MVSENEVELIIIMMKACPRDKVSCEKVNKKHFLIYSPDRFPTYFELTYELYNSCSAVNNSIKRGLRKNERYLYTHT